MYLRVDSRVSPPKVLVRDQGEFSNFKVVVLAQAHSRVDPDALTELAGHCNDVSWCENLACMLACAETQGWLNDHGHIPAHIELESRDRP